MIKYPLNVTIDTNIFEANKFDFRNDSTMSLLAKNVKKGKIHLVLSNIVISEVEKHICRCVDNICGKARTLRKEYLDILPEQYFTDIGMEMYLQIHDKKVMYQPAKNIFFKFLEDCNVERLDTCGINLEGIIDNYFEFRPPFENSEKKRKEFPDAFIAEEIKNRFGTDEIVAIISQDNGFREACTHSKNHLFYSSLGELFDALNKSEKEYEAALTALNKLSKSILNEIYLKIDNSNTKVYGLSFDKDGIPHGYDYDETYLATYSLSSMRLHTIDDIDGDTITASLLIRGNIDINCYFDDFDNAFWDSEEEEYTFVERRHILEKHSAIFPCRIKFNHKTNCITVLPFSIVLGGDSLQSRVDIDDKEEERKREFEDEQRKDLGFLPLSQYGDFLADNLNESPMAQKIIELFSIYNALSVDYESLLGQYDEISTQLRNDLDKDDTTKSIAIQSLTQNIPLDLSGDNIDENYQNVIDWFDSKYDTLSPRTETQLPDSLAYGEDTKILGANNKTFTLSLNELLDDPEPGSEIQVDITISSDTEIISRGCVKMSVGYLSFDEDGGASDGTEESLQYDADEILSSLKELIDDVKNELHNEQEIISNIENCLNKSIDN